MTSPDYHKVCKAFVSAVNQRRGDLIAREVAGEPMTPEEARELRLLQEAVGPVVELAHPGLEQGLRELEARAGIPSPCPRCGRSEVGD